MQQRETIHLEIATITEKIILLNQQFAKTGKLINAEIALMNTYIDELKRLTSLLPVVGVSTIAEKKEIDVNEASNDIQFFEKPVEDKVDVHQPTQATIAEVTSIASQEIETPVLQFIDNSSVVEAETTKPVEIIKEEVKNEVKKSINERFTTEKKPLIDMLSINKKSLKDSISLSDKMLFINSLFNKDSALYEHVINQLNTAQNLNEAESILASFQWDNKKEAVQIFHKMIKKRLTE